MSFEEADRLGTENVDRKSRHFLCQQFCTAAKCREGRRQIYLPKTIAAFWDGRNAHQPQTGAVKQRIDCEAGESVA